jgi:hypothetical protein
MAKGQPRYKYGGRVGTKTMQFICVGTTSSEGLAFAIAEAENYEIQKWVPAVRVGKRIVRPAYWKVIRCQTNQLQLL